jgi:CubicO group peptidase (beta-lactamase class C family)
MRLNTRAAFGLCAAWLLALPASAAGQPLPFGPFADSLMSAQLSKHHIPGAVLAVVRNGRIDFARGYGFANLEHRIPVDAERTMFRVASVSKLFTATAAMQLVEQGRLDLDADVNRTLRRFQVPLAYGKPVTLFELLTHTAGFDESNLARKAHRAGDVESLGAYLARRLPPRIRPPGDVLVYSNHGMALAGYLVEVASGLPFERCVRERIFAPLGMAHSSFDLVPDSAADLATGYDGARPRRRAADYTRTIPASMLAISGTDAARFMIAHLEGGRLDSVRILGQETTAEMHLRQFSQHPLLAGIGFGFWERFQNGERGLWHDGDAAGFASLLYLLPARHTGYFMAFNSRAGSRARAEILAALLGRDVPRPLPPAPPPAHAHAVAPPTRFSWTYVEMRYGHRTLEKIAALARYVKVAQDSSGALTLRGVRYFPIGERLFQSEDGEGRLAFRVDRGGRVTHLFEARSIARGYERVPWIGTAGVQLGWLGFCLLGFVWHVAGALYRARHPAPSTGGALERWTGRVLLVVAASNLFFIAGFGLAIAGAFGSLEYGIPAALVALLTIAQVAAVIAYAALLPYAWGWQQGVWTVRNARLTVVMAASLGFIPWLAYWNLLGRHF